MAFFFPWFLADISLAGPLPMVFIGLPGAPFPFPPSLGTLLSFLHLESHFQLRLPTCPRGGQWLWAGRARHLPDPGPRPGRCPSAGTSRPPARSAFCPPACYGAAAPSARRGRGPPPEPARAAG